MTPSQAAEALYSAHKSRATGRLTLSSGGRESRLWLREGDLVRTQLGFGYQSPAQALLQSGMLGAEALDALWARGGAGAPDEETLEEFGLVPDVVAEQQVLAHVRRLSALAERAAFEPETVEAEAFRPIAGVRVVRAALEGPGQGAAVARVFRCEDVEACGPWLADDSERAFLETLAEFREPESLTPAQEALLLVLEREGWIQALSVEDWEERERIRQEEEEARRREEEARLDEERRREEEARLEAERLAEEARLAELARLEAERLPRAGC
ncbi:molecular chaperone DnaJ, partial [Myxococcus sp. 1LA]